MPARAPPGSYEDAGAYWYLNWEVAEADSEEVLHAGPSAGGQGYG
ncbi:hypothetical protein ABT095_13990 [Kitasatospora sp. NPDC002227]